MDWDTSDTSNEARTEGSVIWLLGWALILPFAHPSRMLAYGVPVLVLLVALSVLFPGASVFGPLLATEHFAIQTPPSLLPYSQAIAWIVLALSALATGFMLCVWQRDILRHFHDPLGQLLTASVARFIEYGVAPLLLALFLAGVTLLVGGGGPVGIIILLPVSYIYARLSFLGPLLATGGWRGAFALARQAGHKHGLGHALALVLLALVWVGAVFLTTILGVAASVHGNAVGAMLIANVANVALTVLAVLWISAMPALILRRQRGPEPSEITAFD